MAELAKKKREEKEAAMKKEEDKVNAMSEEERTIYLAKIAENEEHEKAKAKQMKFLANNASGMHKTHSKKGGKNRRKTKIALKKKKGRTKKKTAES